VVEQHNKASNEIEINWTLLAIFPHEVKAGNSIPENLFFCSLQVAQDYKQCF